MSRRTFVCRCEDVTLAEVDHAIELGLSSVEEIKRYTGLGTGPCQGKECMSTLCQVLLGRDLIEPDALAPFTSRPPIEPVTFGSLAAEGPQDDHET